MKTVKFICNYREDINEWMNKYFIKDFHKLEINKSEPDYYVIINNPFYKNKKLEYDNKKTIYVHNEPESTRNRWDVWKNKETFMYDNKENLKMWHLDVEINDLITKKIIKKEENKRKITCVTTDLNTLPGHKKRLDFLRYIDILPQVNIQPEIYGREKTGLYSQLKLKNYKGDIEKRDNALIDYYYHFMAENSQEKNYFTEKIIDPILSETLCFYWGCPNIKNYLHEKSYVQIDLNRPQIAINTIIKTINDGEYEKRLKYIRETKKKILYELNPATIIQNRIIENS